MVENISLSHTSVSLDLGETLALTATVSPDEATGKTLKWTSSDTSVATVDGSGVVTAVGIGIATITVRANDGSGESARCKLEVSKYDTYYGHDYVDLGLPSGLKWATCNVGANAPGEYGDYFAWGEVEPKEDYSWSTYKWCNGSSNTQTKYCTQSNYGTVDNKTVLEPEDDAAHVNWGGSWRMPTMAEQEELIDNCTWTWITQNGVNGYKVTSKTNGNSIFLPAAGYRNGTSLNIAGSNGDYWSSSLSAYYSCNAYEIDFKSDHVGWGVNYRYYGRSVRPVCP